MGLVARRGPPHLGCGGGASPLQRRPVSAGLRTNDRAGKDEANARGQVKPRGGTVTGATAATLAEARTATRASACASIQSGGTWEQVTDAVCEALNVSEPDLAVVFVDSHFAAHYGDVLRRIREATGARHLIGCSGQGVIGPSTEAEQEPAISVMTLDLPGVVLTPLALVDGVDPGDLFESVEAARAEAWFVFADPTTHVEHWISSVDDRAPGTPVLGGIASSRSGTDGIAVFLEDGVYPRGAVLLGIAGEIEVHALVAQGAEPIGQSWTLTDCESNLVRTIGGRPAVDVLRETLDQLDDETRERAQRNLLVGLAMDEYRAEHGRGDYLIRNIIGFERESGAIAISAVPRIGQTIQFQFRDAAAADDDLRTQLAAFRAELAPDRTVLGALLCACNGRGQSLFGVPHHDAQALTETLGALPTAGLFCNGELGPVGGQTFLHGFTASIGLLTARLH